MLSRLRVTCFVITCEHGGNRIPPRYRALFDAGEPALRTHRGYDPGALALAHDLAGALHAPLFASTVSRLLIDLNRSPGHPRLYSEFTRTTSHALRQEILQAYYLPYRNQVESHIAQAVEDGHRVLHLSSHSFTPELDGKVRDADIGLLYDPARAGEADFCRQWQAELNAQALGCKTRLNYPYSGKSDGLTAYLRRRFDADAYLGIELEINQKHVGSRRRHWRMLRESLIDALRDATACVDSALPGKNYGGK